MVASLFAGGSVEEGGCCSCCCEDAAGGLEMVSLSLFTLAAGAFSDCGCEADASVAMFEFCDARLQLDQVLDAICPFGAWFVDDGLDV